MKRSIVTLLLMGSAMTALAQVAEVSVSGGMSKLRNNSLGTTVDSTGAAVDATANTNFQLAIRMTLNNPRFFGHEFGYAYNHGTLKFGSSDYGGMPIHQGFYNFLVYGTKEGSKVRPFATGGVHFSSFYPPGSSVFNGNGTTKFGYNYGGGVKVKVSESFLVRLDVRDYTTGKPDFGLVNMTGMLHQLVISAGLGFTF